LAIQTAIVTGVIENRFLKLCMRINANNAPVIAAVAVVTRVKLSGKISLDERGLFTGNIR
jgi:hypothetical protein